ncbi:MAG: helix-turn-helix transcriptional regulator [Cytophagales bacterium]|nr:helix-turn-helix transcriptional regulator [Cytophagales bacterium]
MLSKEMIGASTVPIILSILLQGENYGYEIIRKVKDFSGGTLEWSEPMLYPVLHRLERNNHIHAQWRILENGRKRKYYVITPSGRTLLTEKQSEWTEMMSVLIRMWNLNPSQL